MTTPRRNARERLLRLLLEKYERSSVYGRPAPWPRDVIVKVDAATFPEEFGADGREALDALRATIDELERADAVRVIRHRGAADGQPREVRLGPEEVGPATALASAEGFEPLHLALESVASTARDLRASGAVDWLARWLDDVLTGLANADPAALGMSRERLKRERRDVEQALLGATSLAPGVDGWERVLSERIYGDSKRLAALRTRVIDVLVRADPRWEGVQLEDAADLLEAYGVRRKPGLIRCAGAGDLKINGRSYRLDDFSPTAALPAAWAEAWIECVVRGGVDVVTTIENEYPFLAYVEEAGGPLALGGRKEVVVYVAGFPAPWLVDALAAIAQGSPDARFRHWGDADVGGVQIWRLLRKRLGRPMELFRTTANWVTDNSAGGGGRSLADTERAALAKLRRKLVVEMDASAPDVAAALDLLDAVLCTGRKFEQERY